MSVKARRAGSLSLVAVLVFASAARAAEKAEPETGKALAQSALALAASKFKENAGSSAGKNLLLFILELDPANEEALLLQGRLERKLPIETAVPENAEATFVEQALAAAKDESSAVLQLLLYRMVDMVRPGNKVAMVALTKAKRNGQDTRFESLLRAYTGARTKVVKKKSYDIPANRRMPFKIRVKKGDTIRIIARGIWKIRPRGRSFGPDHKAHYLEGQLGAGAPFKVGSLHTLKVTEDTVLYLGVRDPGTHSDNSGKCRVTLQKVQ